MFDCDCILHLFPQKCKREGDDLECAPRSLCAYSAEELFKIRNSGKSAELVGAKPLHLLTQTALPLESPTGAFIATQTRIFQNCLFTGGVVTESSICSAAFCESAALREKDSPSQSSPVGLASSPKGRALGTAEKFPAKP